ncbi:8715_t:CDS:1 [Ambispora leptoticha]|uniref:8715_t:CDS:1 n=1 Tax=Ambispora leptoticha TaxID=144679 RepID=A0A9N8V1V1_9GLOM|nr:8715_t:CDS:1 [Ambispora leptoticha]
MSDILTIEKLPVEVLQQIFIFSSNHNFCLVSRTFYQVVTTQSSVKTYWLLHKYNYNYKQVLNRGLKWKFFNKDILLQLDHLYYQSQQSNSELAKPATFIPYNERPIPSRLLSKPDPDGKAYELVKILLERGASPDEPQGYPLMKSASLGRLDMARLLLSYKANGSICVNDYSPMVISVGKNNFDMVKLLVEYGVKPDEKSLEISVKMNLREITQFLLDHGAVPNRNVIAAIHNDTS